MKWHHLPALLLLMLPMIVTSAVAESKQTASDILGDPRPPEVSVGQSKLGLVYVDSHAATLYAQSRRYAGNRTGDGLKYCSGPCAQIWSPLAAPADARPVGVWSVVDGPSGPQWAYKNDPVFTYAQDSTAGSTAGDGYDDLWRAIPYVPPAPTLKAPANVKPLFVDGAYILADSQGHVLFTSSKAPCGSDCTGFLPLGAGLAARDIGDWTVARDGDRPQWAFHGKGVYVSQDGMPPNGVILRP